MDQDQTWHVGRPRPWPHFLDGDPAPPPKRGNPPNFRPISVVAKWLHALRCHLVWSRPRLWRLCVRWGPSPLPQKGAEPPIFGPYLLWLKVWMDQDGTWHGGRSRSRPHCARWGPSSPPPKWAEPPIFGPCLLRPNVWMDQLPLGTKIGLGLRDTVLDGDPDPLS